MISMQDYMNNANIKTNIINQNVQKSADPADNKTTANPVSSDLKSDSFEKEKNNKPNKKKIIKTGAIVTGIILAVLAFFKRKEISNFLSNLFHKKNPVQSPTPPSTPLKDIATDPKTPSAMPQTKPIQTTETKIQPNTKLKPTNDGNKATQRSIETISANSTTKPALSQYTVLNEKWEVMPDNDPEKDILGRKIVALRKQMIEQNVSFIPKAPESFANDKERWDYLYRLMNIPVNNEATAMDKLEQFAKLGGRMYDKSTGNRSISDIGTSVLIYARENAKDIESSNRIFQKYIDSVFKFATNEIPGGGYSPDARELLPAYNNSRDKMTKDTVIKFINAFKNIAVDKQEYRDISYFLKDGTWQYFYRQLKAEDLPDIQKALDEFAVAVRNLPDDIMKIN